jgi:hypothetical protein
VIWVLVGAFPVGQKVQIIFILLIKFENPGEWRVVTRVT